MGAGASVENPEAAAAAAKAAKKRTKTAINAVNTVDKHVDNAADAIESLEQGEIPEAVPVIGGESPEVIAQEVEAILGKIPDPEIAGQAAAMFESAGPEMTPEEMKSACSAISESMHDMSEMGSVVLVTMGSALNEAAEMAPTVISIVSDTLIIVGPHLPLIGVAAGALGCLGNSYNASKKDDEFVNTFVIWCGGVKDWLMLVAGRVGKSGGENTLPMFEKLTAKVTELKKLIDEQSKRQRITKMLTSGSFNKKFEACKTFVVELKSALKDYLDQEAVDKQEKMLESVLASNIRVEEKLDNIDNKLDKLDAYMEKIMADKEAEEANKLTDTKEETIYAQIQDSVGVERTANVTFQHIVMAFSTFFCDNKKLPAEVKRGLKIAIDEEDSGIVTKLQWISFYRTWQDSEHKEDMFEYLLFVADNAPPTLFSYASDASTRASKLMGTGVFKLSEKYGQYGTMAKDAAMSGAAAVASMGGSMMSSGMSMLGSMSPGKKTAPEAAAAPVDPVAQ